MTFAKDIPAEWRGILRPDERILWQGAPAHDASFDNPNFFSPWIGLVVMIAVPILLLRNLSDNLPFSSRIFLILFGVAFVVSGAWQAFGQSMFASYKLRQSFYTLTSQRAFTGFYLFGRRQLAEWDITRHTTIELENNFHGSVYFAEKIHKSKNSSWTEKIGFLNIRDAKEVFDLMQKVQKGEV